MKRQNYAGFTIVEVVLFLAISGVLAITLLAGAGMAIQRQQYRDSVHSFAGFLRNQYSRVVAVENTRADDEVCPIKNSGGPVSRGRSDCVIIGRYITADADKSNLFTSVAVYALKHESGWLYSMDAISNGATYELEWRAKTRFSDKPHADAPISIIMLRNPENGMMSIHTSTKQYNQSNIGEFINRRPATDKVEVCVYDQGWMLGTRQSIFLGRQAASADAVVVGESSKGCMHE